MYRTHGSEGYCSCVDGDLVSDRTTLMQHARLVINLHNERKSHV